MLPPHLKLDPINCLTTTGKSLQALKDECKAELVKKLDASYNGIESQYRFSSSDLSTLIMTNVVERILDTTGPQKRIENFLANYLIRVLKLPQTNRNCMLQHLMPIFKPDDIKSTEEMAIEVRNLLRMEYEGEGQTYKDRPTQETNFADMVEIFHSYMANR